ncbi:hypothetical protein D3C75_745030 [compost metagenome]
MLPAVVCNDRTVRVDRFGQMIDALREFLLSDILGNGGNAPRFIEWNPGDNARMIILLRHNLQPLPGEAFDSKIIEFIGSGHFRPHQHPLHIAPIQKTGILNFHVLAQAVVAHFRNPINVIN